MKTYLTHPCRALSLLAGAILLAGCAIGPDYRRPEPPKDERYTAQPMPASIGQNDNAQRLVTDMDVPGQWWTLFRSPQLDALIKRSLTANPELAAAQSALRQAREAQAAGNGALFPQVEADYNVQRQRVAGTLSSPVASNADDYTLHTAQLDVSWAPDLFGGERRQLEALRAQTDVQRFQLEAIRLSLTANVVVAAIQQAGLRAQIQATREIVAAQQATLDSFRRQRELGQLSRADVAAQAAALAQAQAALPPLQKQLAQQNDAIAALLGQSPAEAAVTDFDLADLHLPGTLPLSLPAQSVRQRPDVLAAEAQLHAACAEVGVAMAHRLPKFTLSANAGSSPTDIGQLLKDGTTFWSLAADVSEPLFDAGTLKHQQHAAEAALDQAKAQYRSAVVGALQNVADVLYALKFDAAELQAATAAEQASAHSLAIARTRFALGDADHLVVLQAEQAWQQADIARVQAQVARYDDTAALFQALGGGWWHDQTSLSGVSRPSSR